jgi:hypothetical protein
MTVETTAPGADVTSSGADASGPGDGAVDGGTAGGTAGGSAGDNADTAAGDTAGGAATATAGGKAGAKAGGTADPDAIDEGSDEFKALPAWAQKRIRGLEKESGDNRIKAKTATQSANAKAQEAADKLQKFIDGFAQVMGLTDDESAKPPKNLDEAMSRLGDTQQQLSTTVAAHRELEVQLAVWEAGSEHGANTRELMDSAAFLTKISKLDPRADGFGVALGELIKAHMETNPTRFKAAPPVAQPAQSGGEFTGGPGGRTSDADLSVEQHLKAINNIR